jgi:6-pyruvoyltetrahydropterin/6-carboxytetrahydropterin synthase
MYELEKSFTFEAGHELRHHDGKCRTPHGHSYVLTVILRSDTLVLDGPKQNMMIDFYDVSKIVKPMIEEYFDHKWINETLQSDSATVEFMAHWIYHHLKPKLPQLYAISLHETSSSKVTYKKALD